MSSHRHGLTPDAATRADVVAQRCDVDGGKCSSRDCTCDQLAMLGDSLRGCNEKPRLCMRRCARRRSHFSLMKFIAGLICDRRKIILQIPAMALGSV
jgi:hypothetical protein